MGSLAIILASGINTETLVIALAGYLIVFTALLLLFWLFSMVPKIIALGKVKRRVRQGKEALEINKERISGESTAAIAMALHLYLDEIHDPESGVVTIKRVSKAYSPWSSKIYAVRNQFNRL